MTCPELNPSSPPLSYSIASFNTGDFDNPGQKIDRLVRAGFKVLTLIPTYEAETRELTSTFTVGTTQKRLRTVVRFHSGRTPSIDAIRALAVAGIEAGMHIRLEPHIDAEVTLQGQGETYWRARLVFDPLAAPPGYYDVILRPLFDLIAAIKDTPIPGLPNCKPCFSLTLGSELEMSVIGYPPRWEEALLRLKQLRAAQGDLEQRLIFGHKLNWDHFSPGRQNEWPALINSHNREIGSGPANLTAQSQNPLMFSYLSKLDYLGVSFYVPLAGNLPGGNVPQARWQQPPTDQSVDELAGLMEQQWQHWLTPLGTIGPSVEIAEAGIGTTDASMPYDTSNPDSMTTPEGQNVTRHYVRAIARFAQRQAAQFRNKSSNPCMAFMPITFWTVNQCDWLALRSDWQRFGIEDLIEWIRAYNRSTFSPAAPSGEQPRPPQPEPPKTEPPKDGKSGKDANGDGGGKFCMATIALGTSASGVHYLRAFRNEFLLKHAAGRVLHDAYWAVSPRIGAWLLRGEWRRCAARAALQPIVFGAKIMSGSGLKD